MALRLTLSDTAARRLQANHFQGNLSVGLKGEVRFQMVKNEFECIHVARFNQPDIVQFTEAVDATHGIYEHRSVRAESFPNVSWLCRLRLVQGSCS